MAMKTQSEIRSNPLDEPVRINVILEKEHLTQLKQKALFHDTTVNEIIRNLIADYIHSEAEKRKEWSFELSPAEYALLQEIADKEGETVTQLVSTLIRGYIDAHKAINN